MAPRAAAETPSRATRTRSKSPLPAIDAKQSQAYGAPGKANLGSQLRSQSAAFSQQFEESRTAAAVVAPASSAAERSGGLVEEGSEAASLAPGPRRRQYSGRPAPIPEERPAEMGTRRAHPPPPPPPDSPSLLGREATVLDHNARYGGAFAAARAGIWRQLSNPNSPIYFVLLIAIVFLGGIFSGLLALFVPVPASVVPIREQFALGMHVAFLKYPYDRPPVVWERYTTEVLDMFKQEAAKIDGIAQRSVEAWLEKRPSIGVTKDELNTIIRFHQVHNSFRAMHMVNWFSVGLGARIDPYLTSATKIIGSKTWLGALYDSINPLNIPPNPPITALLKWDEATECWCGTPSSSGYVQIAIMTHTKFYPDRLIIEHIPRAATLAPQAAPKDFEVWIDLGSTEEVKRVRDLYDGDSILNINGPCGDSPGKTWYCVLKNGYDINYSNHVQTKYLAISAAYEKIATNKVLVRATSNHGSDYTCFYRLRMAGQQIQSNDDEQQDYRSVADMVGQPD
ncbi:uncharacterized protein LTR77_009136 [Saxophila tyrrhenica]|uniref:SUN domain-containing protein n=1 Tax=Saxophila tyrrhenica TaxID=1690608 RepID=A0AAV9P3L0_9PEZI|nr:hypothetical protein LTR77_009136 [Saxophila tyrrhenica]